MKKPIKKKRKPRAPKLVKQTVTIPCYTEEPQQVLPDPVEAKDPFDMDPFDLPDEWCPALNANSFDFLGMMSQGLWERLGYRVTVDTLLPSQPPVVLDPIDEPKDGQVKTLRDGKIVWENVFNDGTGDQSKFGRTSFGQPSGFVKHDSGKTRFSLVPAEARLEVAKVFTHGAKKYPPHNYRKGTEWSRYMDALQRHMTDFELGQNVDEESGLLTLAHVAACAMILLTLQKLNAGTDDRP